MEPVDERPLTQPVDLRGPLNPAVTFGLVALTGLIAFSAVVVSVSPASHPVVILVAWLIATLLVVLTIWRWLRRVMCPRTLEITTSGIILATRSTRKYVPDSDITSVRFTSAWKETVTHCRLELTIASTPDTPVEVVACRYVIDKDGNDPLAPLRERFAGHIARLLTGTGEALFGRGWSLADGVFRTPAGDVPLSRVTAMFRAWKVIHYLRGDDESPFLSVPAHTENADILDRIVTEVRAGDESFGEPLARSNRGRLLMPWRPPMLDFAGGVLLLAALVVLYYFYKIHNRGDSFEFPLAVAGLAVLLVAVYGIYSATTRAVLYEHGTQFSGLFGAAFVPHAGSRVIRNGGGFLIVLGRDGARYSVATIERAENSLRLLGSEIESRCAASANLPGLGIHDP